MGRMVLDMRNATGAPSRAGNNYSIILIIYSVVFLALFI